MISRKDICSYFVNNAKEIIINLELNKVTIENEIKVNSNLCDINLNVLATYSLEFYAVYNIELKDLDRLHNKIAIQNTNTLKGNRNSIIRAINTINEENGAYILDLIKTLTTQYFNIKRTINNLTRQLQKIESKLTFYNRYIDIDRKVIFHIIAKVNRYYEQQLLDGNRVYLGYSLGYIQIRYPNKNIDKPKVDWNESKKLKKEIIKRGGIPYNKDDHKLALSTNTEYKGEHWFVYHDVDIPYLNWYGTNTSLPNKDVFSFRPANYFKDTLNVGQIVKRIQDGANIHNFNIGIINKMNVLLKAHELQFLKYSNNDI